MKDNYTFSPPPSSLPSNNQIAMTPAALSHSTDVAKRRRARPREVVPYAQVHSQQSQQQAWWTAHNEEFNSCHLMRRTPTVPAVSGDSDEMNVSRSLNTVTRKTRDESLDRPDVNRQVPQDDQGRMIDGDDGWLQVGRFQVRRSQYTTAYAAGLDEALSHAEKVHERLKARVTSHAVLAASAQCLERQHHQDSPRFTAAESVFTPGAGDILVVPIRKSSLVPV